MPHKTHKTAHVLNLLSVGTGKEETAEQAEQTEQIEKKENVSNVQIMDNPKDSSDPLAGLIKDSLEKEILGDMPDSSESSAQESEDPEENMPDDTDSLSEADLPPATDDAPVVIQANQPQANPKEQSKPPAQPAAPQPATQQIQPPALPDPDYCYVNIMDALIDRRLDEFMKKFDTCTCDRCRKDVRALAMSNLPPKYIVMPNTSYAPLISFYANKYQFNIITELTKACLAIISNPRHE